MKDEMIKELVDGILNIMKENVYSIVLYGSVARGNQSEESDIDIAILVKKNLDVVNEDKLSDVVVDLNLKYDKVFSVIDIVLDDFYKWEKVTAFYQNVSKEGIVLWEAA